ncbi:hypothetical protein AM493_00165 [Flavobacterium akiainvivens]|uniref:Heparan-alpha-glucosaminide N-acetyltransferase catalytic domain-containing protein n=1 Tax=Flavobacterium akiainvivens TaxID=1202724 RepID=A0A0M9VGM7_9FLAO|nr:heparan-alpha-glucosaminide N-acetyltransferase domain-containing protein [Flavobacterium akiainvivens]KOS04629.1 hypothetical protein AM493_00165 [Flavobacterium akiainvivens]SFQ65692.1 Uncharacterized membrane protein [Flavobacterium akiainvivens]
MDTITKRIQSIDVLRGIIMAIMALDHSRDFFHVSAMTADPLDAETTTPMLFFTRWITHFCAPTFVFLSGTSIYLQSLRKTPKELAFFLLTRGLWLVLAELTIVGFGWSFDYMFRFFFLQVIWAIGWSMIILSVLVLCPYWVLAALGVAITLGHNAVDYIPITNPTAEMAANALIMTNHKVYVVGSSGVMFGYAILPWTGIMLLGFAVGRWFNTRLVTPQHRKKVLVSFGLLLCTLFVLLRFSNSYGDPSPWIPRDTATKTIIAFLNVTKYPPSLMYACMTLGPSLLVLAAIEGMQNRITNIFNVFGRVPFFYYVLHIYVIHLLTVVMFYMQGFDFQDNFRENFVTFAFRPRESFGVSLAATYLLWVLVLVLCYFPSRWYNNYKSTHKKWWLSYI